MTAPSRREKIEAMLVSQPGDRLLRYMLALELRKEGQQQRSLELLGELMNETPPHVPSFLMAAQQLVADERYTEARTALRRGIEAARRQDEGHAAAEMSELLQRLGEFGE